MTDRNDPELREQPGEPGPPEEREILIMPWISRSTGPGRESHIRPDDGAAREAGTESYGASFPRYDYGIVMNDDLRQMIRDFTQREEKPEPEFPDQEELAAIRAAEKAARKAARDEKRREKSKGGKRRKRRTRTGRGRTMEEDREKNSGRPARRAGAEVTGSAGQRRPESAGRTRQSRPESAGGTRRRSPSEAADRSDRGRRRYGKNSGTARSRRRKKNRRRLNRRGQIFMAGAALLLILVLAGLVFLVKTVAGRVGSRGSDLPQEGIELVTDEAGEAVEATEPETEPEPVGPVPEESDEITMDFNPTCTDATDPKNLIKSTGIQVDGKTLKNVEEYEPAETISFEEGSKYTEMDGIITFRGNSFRNGAAYGFANMSEYALETAWDVETGSTTYKNKTWAGSGWTGQPLITSWPKEVRQHMNMYDWAREKEELTEVIYATLGGVVYFLELGTGQETREPLKLGFTFKGSGALDPRGYPILYLGAGYNGAKGKSRAFIINLLDGSVMYTWGNGDKFAKRNVSFFDSSALVDAETDTLIYPSENGILYLIHLNTQYDPEAGTLSVDPDRVVKWNYWGTRTTSKKYWVGMEDSAVVYKGYIFVADNGGNLMCLNLNTLQLVWVQDTLDDTNCSPVMSVEGGHPYIYISTSFHKGWRGSNLVDVPIFKIDAVDGSIVWQTEYECSTVEDVSGGVQSTIALGKRSLNDYIYCTVSRTGGGNKGVLACISKSSGEVMWEHAAGYAWSSPVCVYNEDGSGQVVYADSTGVLYLVDGLTGQERDSVRLSDGVIESSPAVYNNMLVVGTRARKIRGVLLK